jgi:hypothetical protein
VRPRYTGPVRESKKMDIISLVVVAVFFIGSAWLVERVIDRRKDRS